jgi:hypothetical protein
MIHNCNICLIVASHAFWHTHVSPLYYTKFHLELQRFIFSGIMQNVYCCHLGLFYLWHHHMFGFCNLFCDAMCEVWIGWKMTHSCNVHLIVASHALWHTHVLPLYCTNFHLELQGFILSGIIQNAYYCHLRLFYLWHHRTFKFCNLSSDAMCEVWFGWKMTHSIHF